MRRIRTIKAVFLKEFTQLTRYPTWIIQLIVWPLIFPLMYILSAMGLSGGNISSQAVKTATGSSSVMGFIVVGTMAWMWVNTTMWNFGTYLREEQMRGTLESNWLCPINKFDILIGSALFSIFFSFIFSTVSVLEYRFIYGIHFTGNILTWILMFLIMIPGVYGIGIGFASLVLWAKETNAAVNVVRGTMMILCGITFPIAVMPGFMRGLAKLLPFTYGISATRQIMINGNSLYDARGDIFMCLIEGIILLLIGRIIFIRTEKKVKESGSLERF